MTPRELKKRIVVLIRMCGSQLQRIYRNKQQESQQLQRTCNSVPSDLREKIAVGDNICMTADEKALAQAYLPVSDEGGMGFPRREFFSFSEILLFVLKSTFEKHGNKLFQVNAYYVYLQM